MSFDVLKAWKIPVWSRGWFPWKLNSSQGAFPHQNDIKNPSFPGKSLNSGRVLLPGNPHPAPAASTGRESFQIPLSSWGFLGSRHAVVPSGAKESCGREATCSHPQTSQAPGRIIPGSSTSCPPFPHQGWENPGFVSQEAISCPKRGYFFHPHNFYSGFNYC